MKFIDNMVARYKQHQDAKRKREYESYISSLYDVTVKNHTMFLMCGNTPIKEISGDSTVKEVLKELSNSKLSKIVYDGRI